ncbi:MAG: acyltransferase family protein [Actinobacteria bacterium]|nr:acyltransferase family protein [Actinomycetota bacterium]
MTVSASPRSIPDGPTNVHAERSAPIPHLPGLDGVRGLAVIGVLLFHGGFVWAKGGFLGVSTFFTLSGFLITNLLVREFEGSSSLNLVRFWGRRLRRLMPAALAAIALIGLVWWRIGTPEQLASLRIDMLASLGYVANWRLWTSGISYGSLFSQPTPFQHFWSLAIEEQFYLVFPLVVLACMRIGGRRLLTVVCAVGAVASITLMWLQRSDFDRIYYGTDTRVAELLFGVLLALWWSRRDRNTNKRSSSQPVWDAVGVAALIGILAAWYTINEMSPKLALGGLPIYAALSTLLIYTATRPGLVSRLFSNSALRWAGLLSYGLYLYHWPIFLVLSQDRTGLSTAPLFVLRMAVTLGLSLLSYFFLEMPIRRRTLFTSTRSAGAAALAGIFSVVLCAFAVTLHNPKSTVPYANMKVGELGHTPAELHPSKRPDPSSGMPATVWIIGDSGGMDESPALAAAMEATGSTRFIFGSGPGFGLTVGIDWRKDFREVIDRDHPDVAVVMLGGWDTKFLIKNGKAEYEKIVDEAISLLTDNGIKVLLLQIMPGGKFDVTTTNQIFAEVAARRPGMVDNPSVNSALMAPDGSTPRYWIDTDGTVHLLRKTDGWHLCQEGARNLASLIVTRLTELGWSTPVIAGWEDGAWQQAFQYNDPVGVCDGI